MKFQLLIFVLFLVICVDTKFLQTCHIYKTCSSCIQNECGWCYTTNSCLSSSEIGPVVSKCPFASWETTKCHISLSKEKHFLKKSKEKDDSYNDTDIDNALKKINPLYVNNSMFNLAFKSWISIGKKPYDYNLYNSTENPKGIYKSQFLAVRNKSIPTFSFIDEKNKKNFTQMLVQQIDTLTKAFACDKITKMFRYNKDKYGNNIFSLTNKTKYQNEYEYYQLLASLCGDDWKDHLKINYPKVNNKIIYALFIHPEDAHCEDEEGNKHPLSQIHLRNYPYNTLRNDINFAPKTFIKYPHVNMTITSYVESAIIILQRINLYGQGKLYNSLSFQDGEESKAEKVERDGEFTHLQSDNYYIMKTKNEKNKIYSIVKSDMKLDKKNTFNSIINLIIELPFHKETIIRKKATIDLNNKNRKGYYIDLEELNTMIHSPLKKEINTNVDGYTPHNNYIVILKSSANTKKDNIYIKVNVRNLDNSSGDVYKESLSTHMLHLKDGKTIGNMGIVSFFTFEYGYTQLEVKAKQLKQSLKKNNDIKYNSNDNEFIELLVMKLPETSQTYFAGINTVFKFKNNKAHLSGDLSPISGMKIKFQISKPKNVIISTNIILTLEKEKSSDFIFEVYYNGRDIRETRVESRGETIVNLNSISNQKIGPGNYEYELRYQSGNGGAINMAENSWDCLTLNILLLDI